MLEFERAPQIGKLQQMLNVELADYLAWRRNTKRDIRPCDSRYALHELIPYARIPVGVRLDTSITEVLQPAGWHAQIYCGDEPHYYARNFFADRWSVDWIGEAWLARDIEAGILFLNARESTLPDSTVRLLSSRLYRFSSFWLLANGEHLVVSRHDDLEEVLPLQKWLRPDQLARRLRHFYGDMHGQRGLRP